MRHLRVAVVLLAVLLAGLLATDRVVARAGTPGPVWVLVPAAPARQGLFASGDLRLVDAWAGGRLLQLHGALPVAPAGTWLLLRLPAGAARLAGCG